LFCFYLKRCHPEQSEGSVVAFALSLQMSNGIQSVHTMKQKYDFSKAKRGRIAAPKPEPRGKTRITIRLDEDLVDYFLREADATGGTAGYQTLINNALRQHVEGKAPKLEDTLRRIVREEMRGKLRASS
jgi:uncharacterized protein (DUF4415 family)